MTPFLLICFIALGISVSFLIFWIVFGMAYLSYIDPDSAKKSKLSAFQRICLHPYTTSHAIDMEWDAILNKAMDDKLPVKIQRATVMIGDHEVWVCNWPYGYGELYHQEIQPTRKTTYRLRAYIKEVTGIDLVDGIKNAEGRSSNNVWIW